MICAHHTSYPCDLTDQFAHITRFRAMLYRKRERDASRSGCHQFELAWMVVDAASRSLD
jgi:hypothetical protein